MPDFTVSGLLTDIFDERIIPAEITVSNGIIESITQVAKSSVPQQYILPGMIDSHVHIESSMLVPSEFARLAVVHGTVGTVSDPHEIANVCGVDGVHYMIENGRTVPFKFFFGAPSCVPATTFETAGAALDARQVDDLLSKKEIRYLSEMMNFPGVLSKDKEVMEKIASARKHNKPVDGHAPGLRGEQAKQYISAGISTDHECFTYEEALEKLKLGMKIIIREGSAAKNFEALINLLHEYPDEIMFCSDDKHPDSLVQGHINSLCRRAVEKGINVFNVLKAACKNPVLHYGLDVGLLRENDPADFIIVKDLQKFEVIKTYISGILVAENGVSKIESTPVKVINHFNCREIHPDEIKIKVKNDTINVIEALDGQLITNKIVTRTAFLGKNGFIDSNPEADILKIVVVNRYTPSKPAIGFIKNFGLKAGAIASSVAHDSHNIVAVGVNDEAICEAVNLIVAKKGGVSCIDGENQILVELPVAGLMSDKNGYEVAADYTAIDARAKSLGSKLSAPFMTLSFMALLVIPHLKLSDLGIFDGDRFEFIQS